MFYCLMERSILKQKVIDNTLPPNAEFFMDIDTEVPEMLAYIWGAQNSIINIDDHLHFATASPEELDFFRFSGGKYCIVRYPTPE